VNGKGHGEFFSYRGNGELESKSNYLNDKLHGELINYDENGKVWETNTYVNGVLKSSISICNDSLSQETYLRIYDEMGLDVNLDRYELTQVNSNICHFKLYLSTHRRNYIYKIKEDKLVNLTDGDLLFEYRRDKGITVKVKGQKSYLNDLGGAIWYNSERDLEGKLLALLDIEEGTWISKDQFDDEFQAQLTAQGQDGLVVFQK
jgi:antitoxin component YwqK of YwqJK toxin-antitoxin module